jgi:hypothetical protein
MKKILFQPFDFTKWLVIGFAAFLCGHFSAGGFNFPFGGFPQNQKNPKLISRDWEQWKPWLPIAIGAFVVVILILIVVFSWLRARGNFIFTDCIVRNRAAIAEPWREFRKEGNSYFCFSWRWRSVRLSLSEYFCCRFGFVSSFSVKMPGVTSLSYCSRWLESCSFWLGFASRSSSA